MRAVLAAAKERFEQYRTARGQEGGGGARMKISSPISGSIVSVEVTTGALVAEGAPLLRVVDLDRLWLELRVPESELALARQATGVWFELDGNERVYSLRGPPLSVGARVDASTRTIPLVFSLPDELAGFPVGLYARGHVRHGELRDALAIPRSAVLNEGPASVVFVREAAEHFERRVVELGIRDGEFVEVRAGLHDGESVVSDGAYLLKLAGSDAGAIGDGHAH